MSALDGQILVTGGAGFIGSALIWALNQAGHTNIVIADFLGADEKWKNLRPLRYTDYIEANKLRDRLQRSSSMVQDFTCVFHLGACSSTTEKDAAYLMDNNYRFTQELARACVAENVRLIYASSAATYGDGSHRMDDRSEDLARLRPLNMYGYSKHLFDCQALAQGWLSRIVGLKYFNVYGPNENHKGDMRSLVNKAYQQITTTGRVQLFRSYNPDYRDGEQKRDFLYVKDAVAMTIHFATEGGAAAGLYNLGSGEANTWLALTNAIFSALGRPPAIDFINMPDILRDKYQYYTRADIAKLRETGYKHPTTPISLAVADYVKGYLVPDRHLGD